MIERSRTRLLAAVLLALIGLGCYGAFTAGSSLIAPSPSSVGALPPDLSGEDVLIPSGSGSLLRGWFIPGRKGAVILLHGLHGSRRSQLDRARLVHEAGYSVLLFDFQAHGESPGTAITFGYLESRDARAAVDYLRRRIPGQRVAVIAQSMGAAAAVLANPALPVDAIVLEAMYPDLDTAVADRLTMRLGSWAAVMSPAFTIQVWPRLGFAASELRPIDRMERLTMPKLLIAGSADAHTRIEESRALFAAAAEPKALWVVDGAAHVDFFSFGPDEYRERVLGFLEASMR